MKTIYFSIFSRFILTGFLIIFVFGFVIGQQKKSINSPEIHDDNSVTFRFLAPNAKEVSLAGDCFTINHHAEPMKKDAQGMWLLTLGSLTPDIYSYSFMVDNIRILDQDNGWVRTGNVVENMFLVPGAETDFMMEQNVPHGDLRLVYYKASVVNSEKQMYVYLPPGYDSNADDYEVFYLTHEGRAGVDSWVTMGKAHILMDNLIASGKAKPMIVVMPTIWTQVNGKVDYNNRQNNSNLFAESLVKDIIPFVEENYRVRKGAENRAIGGASFPNVLEDAFFAHMDKFDNVGFFSNKHSEKRLAYYLEKYPGKITNKENVERIKVFVSEGTNGPAFLDGGTQYFAKTLKEYGYNTTLFEAKDGIHEWPTFRRCFVEYASGLFK